MTTETSRSCSAAHRKTSPSGETQRTNPIYGPLSSTLAQNTHEITTEFESLDSPWDVGPSFCYWPLQILDRVREETVRPVQWMADLRSEQSSDPGFSPFVTHTSRKDRSLPVQPADALGIPVLHRRIQEIRSPYRQEAYAYSETEFPSHIFYSSNPTNEPLHLEDEGFIDPYDPRSWSPPSTAAPSPMLGNQRPPSPKGLESPPASPHISTSQPKGWNCPECGKHFHERVLLRSVLFSVLSIHSTTPVLEPYVRIRARTKPHLGNMCDITFNRTTALHAKRVSPSPKI